MDKRNVTKSGIKYKGSLYNSTLLSPLTGQQVQVIFNEDEDCLEVYITGCRFLCKAERVKETDTRGSKMLGLGKKLEDYETGELTKELVSRTNTSILKVDKNQQYQVKNNQKRIKECGPATVLIIRG